MPANKYPVSALIIGASALVPVVFLFSRSHTSHHTTAVIAFASVTPVTTRSVTVKTKAVTAKPNIVTMSPSLSPVTTKLSPTVTMSPSVSPRPATPQPTMYLPPIVSYTPAPSHTPTQSSAPSPSVTPISTASPTPSTSPTPTPVPTATPMPAKVVINEIGWMGTGASSTDEWIELYNPTDQSIDLTGWVIKSLTDGSPDIALTKTIAPQGYFLLERTNDTTISNVSGDYVGSFGKGGLNNNGEKLVLLDSSGSQMDLVDCSAGWFAGDNASKSSMERIDPGADGSLASSWATNNGTVKNGQDSAGQSINATPGARNSVSP